MRYPRLLLAVGLVAAALFLVSCSDDSSPVAPENGGNGNGGGDNLAYDPSFAVYLRDFRLTVNGVWGLGSGLQGAVGRDGRAFVRFPLGDTPTYALLPTGVRNNLNGIWATSLSHVVAVGSHIATRPSVFLHYDGESLVSMEHPFDETLTSVFGIEGPEYYVTGARGLVGHRGPSGWETAFTHPDGLAFWDVWALDNDNIFVVGQGGSIYHYRSDIWAEQATSGTPPVAFDAVWGLSVNYVWAVGGGEIWTKIGPMHWEQQFAGEGVDLVDIHGTDDDVWAVGSHAVRYQARAKEWEIVETFDGGSGQAAVWVENRNDVTVYSRTGAIHTLDGDGWQRERSDATGPPYLDIDRLGSGIYTLQSDPSETVVKRWRPQGNVLEEIESDVNLSAIWCPEEGSIYAIHPPREGEIDSYVYHYDNGAWSSGWLASINVPADIWGIDENNIFVACDFGAVYYHNGEYWTPHSVVNPPQHLHGVCGTSTVDPMNVFAVGDNGTIARFDGATWTPMESHTTAHLRAVWCTPGPGPLEAWAVGDGGVVLHYNGTGPHWTVQTIDISSDLHAVSGWDAENVWAAGDHGLVIRLSDGLWRRIRTEMPDIQLHAVDADAEDSAWFAGDENTLCWTGPVAVED